MIVLGPVARNLIQHKTIAGRLLRVLVAILASLGMLLVIVTVTPLVSLWARALAGPWDDPRGKVLIVLGGSSTNNGVIGGNSYRRSAYAVFAYREGGVRQIIVTGGGNTATAIAASMGAFMECQGVPAGIIALETQSRSTRENALYTVPLLSGSVGRPVLLTSDFHMFRARRVFEKLGINVRPRPIPDVLQRASTWKDRWPAFLDLISESFKIAYYYARGWI